MAVANVTIMGQGTIVLFVLNTDIAKAFVDENVQLESWQWIGDQGFAVDPRCAENLIAGMQDSGLIVE